MATTHMTLSRPAPAVWQISMHSGQDNRLSPELLTELSDLLDVVEAEWRKSGGGSRKSAEASPTKGAGALILTSAVPKFFSNGLHPKSLGDVGGFFENVYDPLMYRLITFPLITISAINGHAFAGGMVLALCTDFRVMTAHRGMMSMNEIFLGVPLPNSFNTWLRLRLPYPALRDTLLGKRWVQSELLQHGMIDEVVDDAAPNQSALIDRAIAIGKAEGPKIALGAWGGIKEGMFYEVMDSSREMRQLKLPHMLEKAFWDRMDRQKASAAAQAKL